MLCWPWALLSRHCYEPLSTFNISALSFCFSFTNVTKTPKRFISLIFRARNINIMHVYNYPQTAFRVFIAHTDEQT